MTYYTADSYKGMERVGEPFYNKSGKLSTIVRCDCPRCGGKGIIIARVENNIPIPIPVDGGICYQCLGKKVYEKEVRLYTKAEYDAMQRAKDRAKEKKDAEMRADAERKQAEWLRRNGFNEEGNTYIVIGETYSIKEELKEAGFRFDSVFMWHQNQVPAGYEDRVVCFHYSSLVEFSAWGEGHYLDGARKKVQDAVNLPEAAPASEWLEGDKFDNLVVTFTKKNGFAGKFGWTNIFTFQTENDNVLVWFTATEPDIKLGDNLFLSGKIKDRTEYKGLKQTVVTRCRIS